MNEFADLAESILIAAREIHLHEYELTDAVVLTASNAQIMRFIDANPGATPGETATATGLRRSNLSAGLRELEALGFLQRRPDDRDGRGVRLYSTETAATNLAVVRRQWAEEIERIVGDPDDAMTVTILLRKLAAGLAAERISTGKPGTRQPVERTEA